MKKMKIKEIKTYKKPVTLKFIKNDGITKIKALKICKRKIDEKEKRTIEGCRSC